MIFDLDDTTDALKVKPMLDTFRHEGMVLEVSYEYSNTEEMGIWAFIGAFVARLYCSEPAPFTYKITVERVTGSEFKLEEVVHEEQGCDLSCPPDSTNSDHNPDQPDRCCGTQVRLLTQLLKNKRVRTVLNRFSATASCTSSSRLAVQVRPLWRGWSVLFRRDSHPHHLYVCVHNYRKGGARLHLEYYLPKTRLYVSTAMVRPSSQR